MTDHRFSWERIEGIVERVCKQWSHHRSFGHLRWCCPELHTTPAQQYASLFNLQPEGVVVIAIPGLEKEVCLGEGSLQVARGSLSRAVKNFESSKEFWNIEKILIPKMLVSQEFG